MSSNRANLRHKSHFRKAVARTNDKCFADFGPCSKMFHSLAPASRQPSQNRPSSHSFLPKVFIFVVPLGVLIALFNGLCLRWAHRLVHTTWSLCSNRIRRNQNYDPWTLFRRTFCMGGENGAEDRARERSFAKSNFMEWWQRKHLTH